MGSVEIVGRKLGHPSAGTGGESVEMRCACLVPSTSANGRLRRGSFTGARQRSRQCDIAFRLIRSIAIGHMAVARERAFVFGVKAHCRHT